MFRELFLTLLSWLVIGPSVFLAGSIYTPLFCSRDVLMRGIICCALGFAILSYGVVMLSALRCLNPLGVGGLLVLPFLLRWKSLGDFRGWLREIFSFLNPGSDRTTRILLGLAGLLFLCLLMGSLSPEIGGDALTYQLNLPKRFFLSGSLAPDLLDYNSFFPLLVNNLYLIGLAAGGVFSAKLFHFFFGGLLFLLVSRTAEDVTRNRALSFFIALVVLLTPAVYNTLSTAYIDVALAFYTLLALRVFLDAAESKEASGFFVGGILAGCGIATKYLSLISALGMVSVAAFHVITTRCLRFWLRALLLFGAGALLACGYWLVRNWVYTANPFFPYFGGLFGVTSRPASDYSYFGLGRSAFQYISLYFNMFLTPAAFGTVPTRIGIFYFLFLPFTLVSVFISRAARGYGIFWIVCTTVMFFIAQADRWMLPVLPAMAIAAGGGIEFVRMRLTSRAGSWLKKGAVGCAFLVLAFYALAGIYHYRYAYLLYTGMWTPQKYLGSFERTADVSEWVNRNLPENARILLENESRGFYFDRPVVRQVFLNWRYPETVTIHDAARLRALLKQFGMTHYLVSWPISRGAAFPEASAVRKTLFTSHMLKEVYAGESRNTRDARYAYRLYRIV